MNARFIAPMDEALLETLKAQCRHVITVEDAVVSFGKSVALRLSPIPVTQIGVRDEPVPQATVAEQRAICGMTRADIAAAVKEAL